MQKGQKRSGRRYRQGSRLRFDSHLGTWRKCGTKKIEKGKGRQTIEEHGRK